MVLLPITTQDQQEQLVQLLLVRSNWFYIFPLSPLEPMDTIIQSTFTPSVQIQASSLPKTKPSASFNDLITKLTGDAQPRQVNTTEADQPVLVGEITSENQTVSKLLMQHKELHEATWEIIHSEQNKDKDYTKIRPGTRIYYNPIDGALTWAGREYKAVKSIQPAPQPAIHPAQVDQSSEAEKLDFPGAPQLELGKTSKEFPTVSHLINNNPQLRDRTWKLIGNSINKDKPFQKIPLGTVIYLNKENMEISWNGSDTAVADNQPSLITPETVTLPPAESPKQVKPAADLSEAVQQYLGTPYEKINCYELIVKGLRQLDIPYGGKNGLYTELTQMAKDRGMASNAYLNGEGIVKAAGSQVLSKTYSGQGNWEEEAASLMREIEPLLDTGQILSFSTRRRGHTGIVSQQNDQWTFINSGRLDNPVSRGAVDKGVGEEVLQEEIRNWFKLAHTNNENLSVTLGQLELEKIRTTLNMPESYSNRT